MRISSLLKKGLTLSDLRVSNVLARCPEGLPFPTGRPRR